jgi:hypothetical protein
MHDQPPWVNKFMFPLAIMNKRTEPLITNRLAVLTKCIAELHQANLEAWHCIEKFYVRRIRPLSRRKTSAFKCPRMADPYHKPLEGCLFVLSAHYIVDNNLALI